jgi:Glycosyl transferase family 2
MACEHSCEPTLSGDFHCPKPGRSPVTALAVLTQPLVSILINNYNYGRFVGAAIESALAQSYPHREVVVVDDGSVDESREVIASYGDRVVPVFKENGGQASAFNAGFRAIRGKIVTFLDADDMLERDIVARIVRAFQDHPTAGMVQCRLELTDAGATPLGIVNPPSYVRMPTADLRKRPKDISNGSWWAPTSGISVSSAVLERIMPLPEEAFRISADFALTHASALCAPVVSLSERGAYYRSHGGNSYNRKTLTALETVGADVRRYVEWQTYLRGVAETVGVDGYPDDPYSMPDVLFLIQRIVLARFAPKEARLRNDTRLSAGWQGMLASFRRPDVGPLVKALTAGWFASMMVLPRGLAWRLANKTLVPQNFRRPNRSSLHGPAEKP